METKQKKKIIAVVRIRGKVNVSRDIAESLTYLHLTRQNHCVVIENNPTQMGMLKKVRDYTTFGEVEEKTLSHMLKKRGHLTGDIKLTDKYIGENTKYKTIDELAGALVRCEIKIKEIPLLKPVFKLKPPSGGYERGGIKKPFGLGGVLGYRGAKINDLLMKMI